MPVAIALGGDPAMIYAASAPLPPGVDEVVFAGWLRGQRRRAGRAAARSTSRCRPRPRSCWRATSIPRERRLEGPFGDHTGYYSLARDYPVFHLTAVTRRARPIYPTTIVGRPPQEDYWLGKATERLFLPIIKLMLPEVVDMNMPAEGVFHNLVIVSIRKRYPGHARKVMSALWGMGLMMLAKTIVVVSEHVNVHDLSEVAWRATGNIDPRRDLMILEGPMDDLDHAALRHRFGGKLGIDATEKGPLDDVSQPWPDEIRMSDEVRELRHAPLEGLRPLSTRPPRARRHQVRAHGLRAALRLHRHGAGRRRLAGLVDGRLGHRWPWPGRAPARWPPTA